MYIGRRNVEGGNRIATFVTNSAREVLGVKGDFGDAWTYDVYAQHGTVDNNNGNLNYLNNTAIQEALNVLPGPGGRRSAADPPTRSAQVRWCLRARRSHPIPPACPGTSGMPNGVTPAHTAFLSVPLIVVGNTTEYVANGSVTGDLGKYGVKLPSADQGLQVNVGVEWREESTELPAGLPRASRAPRPARAARCRRSTGSFTVREAFTEVRLPLASHVAGADDLAFEGGYRYSKYSLGFNTNTYKLGLEWAPVRDIRLRGSFQRAVRAPNIGELFTPQAVGLDGAHDPCSGARRHPTGRRHARSAR